jgi:sugar/nucleoside kinase (ribokinase family)
MIQQSSQHYDVIGIGVSAVDDTLTIEKYPRPNVKVPVLESTRHGGGLACTATAAAAMLSGRAAFIARFGDDELSRYMREILARRGVDVSHIVADAAGQPYHSRILIDASTGERTVFYDQRRFRPVQPDDLPDALLASTAVLLVDFLNPPSPIDLVLKARRLRVPVVVDLEAQLPESGLLAKQVDHLVVPEEFARWVTGEPHLQEACASLAGTPRAATVVTAGADGCWWTDSAARPPVHLPAFAVKAVSTNGCGDTFHGAYALAIARQLTIAEAVLFASACAAIKAAGASGGWDALPTAEQVAAFLRERLGADHPHRHIIAAVEALAAKPGRP